MSVSEETSKINHNIDSDNYLLNSYYHLIKNKEIHILLIIIEILLNILQELEVLLKGYKFSKKFIFYSITNFFDKIASIIKLVIIIGFILIFDLLYIFIRIKKFRTKLAIISIIINLLEMFWFRTFGLIFFNLLFKLEKINLIIGVIFLIPHIYININNFLFNNLYYYVPEFIDYPYDKFSSKFDIILIIVKLFLSLASSTNNLEITKINFVIILVGQIIFSFYFILKLKNESYLFMKNSILNKMRTSMFFTKTIILIFAVSLGKKNIINLLFLSICVILLIIIISYICFIYSPFSNIIIKKESPMENLICFFFIISQKNDYSIVLERKINEHYERCGNCYICKKFIDYMNKYKYIKIREDEEVERLIIEDNNTKYDNNKDQLKDLYEILNYNKNKYFKLIKKLIINYKIKGKKFLNKNSYYYINLSFLIYSDYQENNINLFLNERIILEVLKQENYSILDNHKSQINQIMLLNNFISLSFKILNQAKEIINSDPNFNRAKKLLNLSVLLKEMENKKLNKNLFNHKLENILNSKDILLICSLVFEEIFNITLNNSQIPIRENIQSLQNLLYNNSNKNSKIISLALCLANKNCQIIRAGSELYLNLNKNLFDLFPFIFKQYQIDLFMKNILDDTKIQKNNYNNNLIDLNNSSIHYYSRRKNSKYKKSGIDIIENTFDKNLIEIKLILSENISTKMNFKLLTLHLTVLFNNESNLYLFFDGFYNIDKNILITLTDIEDDINPKENLIFISNQLEKNKAKKLFNNYITKKNNFGFIISKIATFNLSLKLYNIYNISKQEIDSSKKIISKRAKRLSTDQIINIRNLIDDNKSKNEKMELNDDNNTNISSQKAGSTNSNGKSNLISRNKKKDNIYEYGDFNKLKRIIYIIFFIYMTLFIIQFSYSLKLFSDTSKNSLSLYHYREFYQLYYQLFSSIIEVTCIYSNSSGCLSLINIFQDNYYQKNQNKEFFNYTLFVMIQNEDLAEKMMDKKKYLVNIHQDIGNQKYNELFGKNIGYYRIIKNVSKDKIQLNITQVTMQFSEAILIICNQFQLLSSISYNEVFIMNKNEDPFTNYDKIHKNKELNENEKEFYEMILNYKVLYDEFKKINIELTNVLNRKSGIIQIFFYFNLTFDAIILIILVSFIYLYNILFELILIKIINYINMTINIKNDKLNFTTIFLKKIENLETILQFYIVDPIKIIKNINSLYDNYQKILLSSNKKNYINKNDYKKVLNKDKENDLDNIPKHHQIIARKDIKLLRINFIFVYIYNFNVLLIIIFYSLLIILYSKYFKRKNNIYKIIDKNTSIEIFIYRAINFYHLMIFQNYTIKEIESNIFERNGESSLFENFYYILELAFNNKKEKNNLGSFYKDFEDESNFTCKEFYEYNNDLIKEIENNSKSKNLRNITSSLIELCEYTNITKFNDYRTVYEMHFQFIKNGMIYFKDSSYEEIINYIKTNLVISTISLHFNTFIIYIISMINNKPHSEIIFRLLDNFKLLIKLSGCIYLFYSLIAMILASIFYIPRINYLCDQIIILKNVFKISSNRE